MNGRDDLLRWMDALEGYARDWDECFKNRPTYFTQEFWYMLVGCMRANWEGKPMKVSELVTSMKSGSARTREERIKRAVDDGYLMKIKSDNDRRKTVVVPTPALEALLEGHLDRTLTLRGVSSNPPQDRTKSKRYRFSTNRQAGRASVSHLAQRILLLELGKGALRNAVLPLEIATAKTAETLRMLLLCSR